MIKDDFLGSDAVAMATCMLSSSSKLPARSLQYVEVTSQLQYIEDSEPVVDGSRDRWCAVQCIVAIDEERVP